jgi:peptidoglycan hydrolase-like protein with peptidoglycan-binding domain
LTTYQNGRLPDSVLTSTFLGGRLRKDAADSANRMSTAFALEMGEFLMAVSPKDTYRDYATQVEAKKNVGRLAATPGTSNHGWGVAVDFANGMNSWTSAAQKWFAKNGAKYGWVTPDWASNPKNPYHKNEPWHKEYNPSLDRMKKAPKIEAHRGSSLGLGSRGKAVEDLQRALNKVVHSKYKVVVDGDYGLKTTLAVLKYQQSMGLTLNGKVGKQVNDALAGKKVNTPKPGKKPKPSAKKRKPKTPPTLRRGSKSTPMGWVGAVQWRVGSVRDGVYGANTERDVKKFQRSHGLVDDGVVGPRTWVAMLYGKNAVAPGDRGTARVLIVQLLAGVTNDAIYGRGTVTAVKEMQRYLGVEPDAHVGQNTRKALLSHLTKGK